MFSQDSTIFADSLFQICEEAFKKAGEQKQVYHKHWLDSPWSGFFEGKNPLKVSLVLKVRLLRKPKVGELFACQN